MLICISVWNLNWLAAIVLAAAIAGLPGMVVILIVAFFPPIVVIRKIWNHAWLDSDVILVWLSVAPALFLSIQEATRPHTPNLPWLMPVIGAYLFTGISVFFLRFSEKDITELTQHRQVKAAELPAGIEGTIDPLDPDAEIKKRANCGELKCLLSPNREYEAVDANRSPSPQPPGNATR